MKKILFLLILSIPFASVCSYAAAATFFLTGSNLTPAKQTRISLKKEVLSIRRSGEYLIFDADYEFNSPDVSHVETVCFIERHGDRSLLDYVNKLDGRNGLPEVSDLRLVTNGEPIRYSLSQYSQCGFKLPMKLDSDDYVYIYNITFKNGINKIHHTYQRLKNKYLTLNFEYDLTGGEMWANGEIEDLKLYVNLGVDSYFGLPRQNCRNGVKMKWKADSSAKISYVHPLNLFGNVNPSEVDCEVKLHTGSVTSHLRHFKPWCELFGEESEREQLHEFQYIIQKKTQVDETYDLADKAMISAMSDTELYFYKYFMFALHDCEFSDPHLSEFFSQFTWYFPYPERSPDSKLLNSEEYKAFTSIQKEEKERTRAKHPSFKFEDYKVSVTKPLLTHINWKSNPTAKFFRTIIKDGVKRGTNFAGHYSIVEWGCGSPCQEFVIIDLTSGKIYDGISTVRGLEYHPDSRLILLNPILTTDGSDLMPDVLPEYYEWRNNHLHLIKTNK